MHRYQIFLKIPQWDQSPSMWTDGRTDMTKLIVAFRNFVKASKHVLMRMQTEFIGLTIWRAVGCYKWDNKPLIT